MMTIRMHGGNWMEKSQDLPPIFQELGDKYFLAHVNGQDVLVHVLVSRANDGEVFMNLTYLENGYPQGLPLTGLNYEGLDKMSLQEYLQLQFGIVIDFSRPITEDDDMFWQL